MTAGPLHVAAQIASVVIWIFLLFLMARLVLSWVFHFARSYTPKGVALVAIEGVFTVTDPPIHLVRRVVKPLRVGPVQLDLAFLVVWLVCVVLLSVLSSV